MSFALGAIVSPTDPAAATAIMRRVGAPRRMVNVLEGESLFNDATALVAYKVAVAAAVGESVSAGPHRARVLPRRGRGHRHRPGGRLGDRRGAQARDRHQHRADDLAVQRLRRLRPGRPARRLGRPGRGRLRRLPRLPRARDRLAGEPDAGLRAVVDPRLPAQRGAVHPHRAAAAGDRRRAQRPAGRRGPRLRGGRLRGGDRASASCGTSSSPSSSGRSTGGPRRSRAAPSWRSAGRRRAGRGCAAPCRWRRRWRCRCSTDAGDAAARPRADPVHHLRADPRHRGRAGPDAAVADPPPGRRRGRHRGGARGAPRAAGDRPRRARPGRRARGARTGRATAPSSASAGSTSSASGASRSARARSRTRTGSRRARSPTSG